MNQSQHFNKMVKRRLTSNSLSLPNTYQQVDYLYSDGNQYINTGIRGVNGVEIDGTVNSYLVWTSDDNTKFGISFWHGYACVYCNTRFTTLSLSRRYKVSFGSNVNWDIYIDDVYSDSITEDNQITVDDDVYLFGSKNGASAATEYIYYVKLYKDGVLAGDLIPCIRKSDDKPGMYDLVNRRFLTNIGTGEFSIDVDS